jgi:hypothetical protein
MGGNERGKDEDEGNGAEERGKELGVSRAMGAAKDSQ